jgi:D-alanyl-D-alanine carboxypeptidase (penicillin-binding protein 5/6)
MGHDRWRGETLAVIVHHLAAVRSMHTRFRTIGFRAAIVAASAVILCFQPEAAAATKKKKAPVKRSLSTPAVSAMDESEISKRKPGEAGSMPKKFKLLQPGELPLKAPGAIVIDGFTGEVLYEKDANTALFPASTTKAMTALLVIEAGDLDREIVITEEDSRVGESSLSIKPGDRYTRRQMLYGLMLKSANDVAHALGRDNAGTMPAFAEKMTLRARELGATNSSFKNPHGLHHIEHYTTPHDLAVIARCAMQQPLFRRIVSTRQYSWQRYLAPEVAATKKPEIWQLSNHNRLLTKFDGCTGVKTGYTNPAQHTLISAALRGGREVIAAVMRDGKYEKWEDSMLLLTHGLENPPKGAL